MLRSLVGSEMCIRDRLYYQNPKWLKIQEKYYQNGQNLMTFKNFPIKLYPCLLYTSDAADDLLCVDLGGRRIIKKKNNKQQYTTSRNCIRIHNTQ